MIADNPAKAGSEAATPAPSLLWTRIRANKMLLVGGSIALMLLGMSILAPWLTRYSPTKMNFGSRFSPPSAAHFMGTDQYGRDTFTRILYGARVSFKVGAISIVIGMVGGILLGAAAGFIGGLVDNLLMRMMDALLAFPPLLLAIGLVAAAGPSLMSISVVIGVVYIPRFARVMRSAVLAEIEKEYVEAARALGQSGFKILFKHIGPSTISPVIVLGTVIFALAIIIEATLSFLGVGLPPPAPSWGTMLNEARNYMRQSVWMAVFPGVIISVAVLGFNLLGDGLRDFLDPKNQTPG
jgi:ABC-type dipeptide/oligopeptide/nickel transport system permease subunit